MDLYEVLSENALLFVSLIIVIGLLVGSFLNVVIYRLPRMMESRWKQECQEYLAIVSDNKQTEPFNLIVPGSRCPHCNTPIRAYQNIPLLSFILLKGKCAACKHAISWRYPFLEFFTGILSGLVAWHFGFSAETFFGLVLTWALIALACIDYDQQLLPDSITLPLLWLGLLISLIPVFSGSHSSIIGAVSGYLSLWLVYQIFKLLTAKEGMGYGDFKLLAMLGAWLGWQTLPLIIILSSLVGALFGIAMILLSLHERNRPIPFGPFLAAAGWITLLWGDKIQSYYLNFTRF